MSLDFVISISFRWQKIRDPADGATKREYAKQLVRQLNLENPGVKDRMFHAITNGNIEGWPQKGENR